MADGRRPNTPLTAAAIDAEGGAREYLLMHRLFRSDKTGAVINEDFTKIANPYRWHYDYLRALEYLAQADAEKDPRLEEAVDLLRETQNTAGSWPNQKRYTAKVFFWMGTPRQPSRWNTLRALRVLKWWENQ